MRSAKRLAGPVFLLAVFAIATSPDHRSYSQTSASGLATVSVPAGAGDAAPGERAARRGFDARMVKLGGDPARKDVREHLKFCARAGFNALWVYSHEAGRWTAQDAPKGPHLTRAFLRIARWCRRHDVRIAVSVNPVADSRDTFVFHDQEGERRVAAFFDLLRRKAGVRDFVVSFDDQPTRLSDIDDILHYGAVAAPAHLDLAGRLDRIVKPGEKLWLCASVYCDDHLEGDGGPYGRAFLQGVSGLPADIGIVWTGPSVISHSVTGADLAATRSRLGGRPLLLYDNFPSNDDGEAGALGLVLSPLRHRSADLAAQASVYLACPMTELGASRLPLMTVADYLADPSAYDADSSLRGAIVHLAGRKVPVREALAVQAAEWGGWIDEPRYKHVDEDDFDTAAASLDDPSAADSWESVAREYPARIALLHSLSDAPFRRDLLAVMERRLTVARAWPALRRYRMAKGPDGDASEATAAETDLRRLRRSFKSSAGAARAFDLFLEAAGVKLP